MGVAAAGCVAVGTFTVVAHMPVAKLSREFYDRAPTLHPHPREEGGGRRSPLPHSPPGSVEFR